MQLIGFENFDFNLVEIVINNSCPLDCKYCFLQNQGKADFMSCDTLIHVFEMCKKSQEIHKKDFISIMFALKEPLVSWKIIQQAIDSLSFSPDKYNIFLTINTNGVLLTPTIITYCREHLIDLHISLDGPQDIHDRERIYRGHNKEYLSSWSKVMDIIKQYPNYNYMSFMTTLNLKDLDRVEEIFHFMSNLPISKWIYSVNKFEDWNYAQLETHIKNFIDTATPQQLQRTAIANTAAAFPNLQVTNSLKIIQDGTVFLQPPVHNEGAIKGDFTSRVLLGNVNNTLEVPEKFRGLTYKDYEIIGENCTSDCILYNFCKQAKNTKHQIYISSYNCNRAQHFSRMQQYLKGDIMTEQEYINIRNNIPLTNAVINLTDNCNLRCPYCFTEHNIRTMDFGTLKSSIMFILNGLDKFESHKPPCFNFFGGEPMLHYDDLIKPSIEWVEENGLREKYKINFGMTTNGTLLNEERIKWLKQHEVSILLSIDGAKYTQDKQRPTVDGKSSFEMVEKNIPTLLTYFPYTTFRSAIEPENVEFMYENYLYARKMGFLNYFITPNVSAQWSIEDIQKACEQLSLISTTIYRDISQGYTPLIWGNLMTNIRHIFENNSDAQTISYNHCGIGTASVGIATNGDLYGCQEHNTYINHDIFYIGNIFTGIDPIKHRRLLSEYAATKHPVCKNNPNLCEKCSFYNDCAGNYCPSHNIGNGNRAIENDLISCVWKSFTRDLAILFLEETANTHNQKVINFLEKCFINNTNQEYTGW